MTVTALLLTHDPREAQATTATLMHRSGYGVTVGGYRWELPLGANVVGSYRWGLPSNTSGKPLESMWRHLDGIWIRHGQHGINQRCPFPILASSRFAAAMYPSATAGCDHSCFATRFMRKRNMHGFTLGNTKHVPGPQDLAIPIDLYVSV